jgi:hypothetical protein
MFNNSIRRLSFAAAAVGLASGLALTVAPAHAATPSCGSSCVEPFSHEWGHNQVLDAKGGGVGFGGQEIILFRASHDDAAEDFTYSFQGTVHNLVGLGLLAPATLVHYANDQAFELEYSPLGFDSGLCVGTWPQPGQVPSGFRLRLFLCGVSARTIWIVDHFGTDGNAPGFGTVISGTTTNFSHPPVWTYPPGATPFDFPRPDVRVFTQISFSGGTHPSSQQWGARFGVLP